ncbi:hypothetical protein QFZ82_000324 [Streptomyces sp. V4I23]|uniref:hypothetical protein n=1 Tax=Streptomyces sp. V4I23 TaxID=3042282 RepID=UPI00277D359B|nr:hypothetical protein [Streptomyces sp. V4I23]MDQ1005839.1 hypothetical protein [Streptomyces sp. V4I23]
MAQLVEASAALTEATAAADPTRPPTPEEDQALLAHTELHRQLDEITARHALLMHAAVLADAEEATGPATHTTIAAAQQATPHNGYRTADEAMANHAAFMARVGAGEDRIALTVGEQRQLTRDALHRLFPQAVGSSGLHLMRAQLIEHSGLGLDAYNRAYRAIGEASCDLEKLSADYCSNTAEPGSRPPVTAQQVDEARTRVQEADDYFADLQLSRRATLRAVAVLDGAAGLEPSCESAATRAARIAGQSRHRALQTAPAAADPRRGSASTDHQTQHTGHLQTRPTGLGIRLP